MSPRNRSHRGRAATVSPNSPGCSCSRRDLLRGSAGGLLALLFSGRLAPLFADDQERIAKAKACIFLFMSGGPSHLDTFDPKPGSEFAGEFEPIRTRSGFQICEHLPRLAAVSRDLAVIRSMTSPEVDHGRGTYYLRSGYRPQESVEHPTLGSVFAKELGGEEVELPPFVQITPFLFPGIGGGPGLLGDALSPFVVENPGELPLTLSRPADVSPEAYDRRLRLLHDLDGKIEPRMLEEVRVAQEIRRKAVRYMSGNFSAALDLSGEDESLRERYGRNDEGLTRFGQSCLLARRLVERGVKFVEVTMERSWDTHEQNFDETRSLCGELDPAFATLIADLESRGLLESTLIVWGGEFGRTPEINSDAGRDHHGDAFSMVLAGGGVRGGQAVGASDEDGRVVADRPYGFPDLMGTIAVLSGIDPKKEYHTPDGRPIKIAEYSNLIEEVL